MSGKGKRGFDPAAFMRKKANKKKKPAIDTTEYQSFNKTKFIVETFGEKKEFLGYYLEKDGNSGFISPVTNMIKSYDPSKPNADAHYNEVFNNQMTKNIYLRDNHENNKVRYTANKNGIKSIPWQGAFANNANLDKDEKANFARIVFEVVKPILIEKSQFDDGDIFEYVDNSMPEGDDARPLDHFITDAYVANVIHKYYLKGNIQPKDFFDNFPDAAPFLFSPKKDGSYSYTARTFGYGVPVAVVDDDGK